MPWGAVVCTNIESWADTHCTGGTGRSITFWCYGKQSQNAKKKGPYSIQWRGCNTNPEWCSLSGLESPVGTSTSSSVIHILEFSFISLVHNCWGQDGGWWKCHIPDLTDGVVCYLLSHAEQQEVQWWQGHSCRFRTVKLDLCIAGGQQGRKLPSSSNVMK